MKKLLIFALIVFAVVAVYERYSIVLGMLGVYPGFFKEHKMTKEIIVTYGKNDLAYNEHHIYKRVFRKYNYLYKDSTYNSEIDDKWRYDTTTYVNEYKDTVCIEYRDYLLYN